MVIPLDRYSELSNARPNILIPSGSVLPLNGTTTTGLHPSMTGLRDLYTGKVNFCSGRFILTGISVISRPRISGLPLPTRRRHPIPDGLAGTFDEVYLDIQQDTPMQLTLIRWRYRLGSIAFGFAGANINMGYNAPNPDALINVGWQPRLHRHPWATMEPKPTFYAWWKTRVMPYANRIPPHTMRRQRCQECMLLQEILYLIS